MVLEGSANNGFQVGSPTEQAPYNAANDTALTEWRFMTDQGQRSTTGPLGAADSTDCLVTITL